MLVIKRKCEEEVRVGRMTIRVIETAPGYVRLGFIGPDVVVRAEIDRGQETPIGQRHQQGTRT